MGSRLVCLLLVVFILGACGSISGQTSQFVEPNKPSLRLDSGFFATESVPSLDDIFTLDNTQQGAFLDYYYSPTNAHVKGHVRLANYLELYTANFDYRGETNVAQVSLKKQAGNCLSLAILTTALAKLVGLEVDYEKVNSAPIYQRYTNLIMLSSHVRTVLYDPSFVKEDNYVYFFTPRVIIDYFPQQGNVRAETISQADFISMFYQNLAGDDLVQKNYTRAYSLLTHALSLSELNPNTLNSLAVLYKQAGNPDEAEYIYQYALENALQSVNTITNYIVLLEEEGREDEAQFWRAKVETVDDNNPYRWLDLGDREYANTDFNQALTFYRRAAKAAPYLHESYFALARAHYQLGDIQQAQTDIQKAITLSYVAEDKRLYQAKLLVLEQH